MLHALRIVALLSVLMIAGCASGPPEKYAIHSTVLGPLNSGLVVGRIENDDAPYGTGISFRGLTSHEEVIYKGATDFSLWLPEGDYELAGVGSRAGSLGPFREPLRFAVAKEEITYVGTISYGCGRFGWPKWYGLNNCGLLALGQCTVSKPDLPLCVGDERDRTIAKFLKENPTFSSMPVRSSILR